MAVLKVNLASYSLAELACRPRPQGPDPIEAGDEEPDADGPEGPKRFDPNCPQVRKTPSWPRSCANFSLL